MAKYNCFIGYKYISLDWADQLNVRQGVQMGYLRIDAASNVILLA
jgi:hypothetical protein